MRRKAAGLEYNFIPVTIKHKDAAVVLWRHNNATPTALSLGDARLTRRHNEAARRMQQLVQHHAARLPHRTLVRILPNDLKQLDRMIGAGLQQTRAFQRNGSPGVSVRWRRSSEARRCSPALPVPPAPPAVEHTKKAVACAALFQHEGAQGLRHAYAFCVVSLRRELSLPWLCSPDGSGGCDAPGRSLGKRSRRQCGTAGKRPQPAGDERLIMFAVRGGSAPVSRGSRGQDRMHRNRWRCAGGGGAR